jgi:hypothetical protein
MEIIAYGVLADEEPLLHDAFARELGESHELRCLRLFLNRATAPTAAVTRWCSAVSTTPWTGTCCTHWSGAARG